MKLPGDNAYQPTLFQAHITQGPFLSIPDVRRSARFSQDAPGRHSRVGGEKEALGSPRPQTAGSPATGVVVPIMQRGRSARFPACPAHPCPGHSPAPAAPAPALRRRLHAQPLRLRRK
ncbi:hypothetical protein H8959_003471 [Pygathrix nigripes]